MELKTHGGKCCGIKVIHGLGISPAHKEYYGWAIPAKKIVSGYHSSNGQGGWEYGRPGENFFLEAAPTGDTYLQRFDRFLDYLSRWRPCGLVEVAVTDAQSAWFPILETRGFKRVSTFGNTNTGKTIHSYHLVMDGKNKPWEAVMDFERIEAKVPEPAEPDPVIEPDVEAGGEG